MQTEKKMRLMWIVMAAATVIAVALSSVSMLLEFESDIGYYTRFAPIRTVSQILTALFVIFAAVMTFTSKKHELCPVLNYNSAAFRFFASMTACLSLLNTYVEFTTLRTTLGTNAVPVSSSNVITILALASSVASFFVYFNYCFGKNEKRSSSRGLCGMISVAYLLFHLMETHLVWPTQMNNPVKNALQISLIVTIFALTYTFKCEFAVNKASGRLRTFFMLVCPILTLTFAIPTVIAYYARIYTSFGTLVDAIYLICACGFVLASYMPVAKARPIAAAEWAEISASLDEGKDDGVDLTEYTENTANETEKTAETDAASPENEEKSNDEE